MNRKEWIIKAENELRCEISETEPMYVRLLHGSAEVFGIEMALGKEYAFLDENFAIFSWYGCTVETIGNNDTCYLSDTTPMVSYVNTHIQLEARRDVALANSVDGPRVLIVGPSDHGKSTTARILAAYAARLDRTPFLVDLDVGQSSITIPGCISAIPLDKTSLNIEEGFSNLNPLVFFHGHSAPKENIDFYKHLVSTLAAKIKARSERDPDTRASGFIVNTCGWIDGPGYDLILYCAQALQIDVVLVMSHDRLHASLLASLGESVTIVKLAHSGGAVQRDPNVRRRNRKTRIRQYFYGRYKFPSISGKLAGSAPGSILNMNISIQSLLPTLSPSRLSLKLSTIRLYRAGGVQLSEGMRLIGETASAQDNTQLVRIPSTPDLVNSIVAVLHPPDEGTGTDDATKSQVSGISSGLNTSNAAGFVSIVSVDIENDTLTVLSPCPGMLPSKHLLVGSLKWVE